MLDARFSQRQLSFSFMSCYNSCNDFMTVYFQAFLSYYAKMVDYDSFSGDIWCSLFVLLDYYRA